METRLAATYGTSQAPVREALRELEVMRLVETQPRRGTFVRPFVHETLRESYVVRAALEETAVRLALLAGTVPVEALRSEVEAMVGARPRGRRRGLGAGKRVLPPSHRRGRQNELLRLSWEGLQIEARTSVTMLATNVDLGDIARDHAALLEAIELGDLETACKHARDHQWHYADLPHDAHGRIRDTATRW